MDLACYFSHLLEELFCLWITNNYSRKKEGLLNSKDSLIFKHKNKIEVVKSYKMLFQISGTFPFSPWVKAMYFILLV